MDEGQDLDVKWYFLLEKAHIPNVIPITKKGKLIGIERTRQKQRKIAQIIDQQNSTNDSSNQTSSQKTTENESDSPLLNDDIPFEESSTNSSFEFNDSPSLFDDI